MKRKIFSLTLALVTMLMLSMHAFAADYGLIYDETDLLWSEGIETLGTEVMPAFRDTYGIDLRVDVLGGTGNFDTLEEAAEGIYYNYDYGAGEGKHAVTLSLLVHLDDTGVALDEWYVYAGGDSDELTTNGVWNVYPELNDIMTEENWAGDAEADAETLALAVSGMVEGLEDFVLAGGVAGTIWSPVADTGSEENHIIMAPVGAGEITGVDSFPAAGETIGYVTDTSGVLTAAEQDGLEDYAQTVSEQCGFGVYVVTVPDFRAHTSESDVFDAAMSIYKKYDMGVGEEEQGVLLLLSTETRDYSLITYGDYGNFLFDEETRNWMIDGFIGDLGDNRWYDAFANYVSLAHSVLADGPDRLDSAITGKICIIVLVPLLIAAVVVFILGLKMKTVARAREALAYTADGLQLTEHVDMFINSTVTRRKNSDSSDSGGGSRSHRSSGGFSGTSGKF